MSDTTLSDFEPPTWSGVFPLKRRKLRSKDFGGEPVIPGTFDYLVAHSVYEAVTMLDEHGDSAKVLAGGQSLIPLMRFRMAEPGVLIDINRVEGLEYIQERDGMLHIGALTREEMLDSSALIRDRYPILYDTATVIADPVVRNWATVGGNLAHADPANDHPATMLALGARIVATGPNGTRTLPIDEFFTDSPFETALAPNELLTEIQIPAPIERSGGAYFKLERKVGDYAIAGVAAYLVLDEQGNVSYAGIGLTNVGPTPIKARDAEQSLLGKPPNDAAIHAAADLAAAASQPVSDTRGPAEYKRDMVRTLTVRALRKAYARATGGK
jgi:carbon-monoxide dehydrogenase medium subunit